MIMTASEQDLQKKTIGIIQSNYIPWRGYFDFIDDVDVFIFLDDTQYTTRDWRNRNKIKGANGLQWLTVPVKHKSRDQLICETEIDYTQNWQRAHLNAIQLNYKKAPFCNEVLLLTEDIFEQHAQTISELNIEFITRICRLLNIETELRNATEFSVSGRKTQRLIELIQAVEGDQYLSGPSAKAYIDNNDFEKSGISLAYKSYDYPPYPQLWGNFEGAVSILDLIANCGFDCIAHIKSLTENNLVTS
jgi:hypothetical protein